MIWGYPYFLETSIYIYHISILVMAHTHYYCILLSCLCMHLLELPIRLVSCSYNYNRSYAVSTENCKLFYTKRCRVIQTLTNRTLTRTSTRRVSQHVGDKLLATLSLSIIASKNVHPRKPTRNLKNQHLK